MTSPTWYIETPRLTISYLLPENDAHCDFLVSLYNTPEFIGSIGGSPTSITTREKARGLLAGHFRETHARLGYGTYLVSLIQQQQLSDDASPLDNATPIGTVSLMRGDDPDHSYTAPDLGFAILTDYMRKGYTKEACQGLLKYVGEELGVKEVLGLHNPENVASYAVFRSLGFTDQGLRVLKVFGGVVGQVWTSPGMGVDRKLSVYGLPDEVATLGKDKDGSEKGEGLPN